MGQRGALLLATFLTTFGLVLIGAVAMRLTSDATNVKQALTAATETDVATAPETTAGVEEQALQAVFTEREAAYQEALRQANAQIEAAYNQLSQASAASASAPVNGPVAPVLAAPVALPAVPTFAVSPDMAAQIALSVATGATLITTPELVDFQGTVAYEVNTSAGLIYVDANTGAVVFNSAAQVPVQASGGGGTTPATQPIPPPPGTQISEQQAIDIALSVVGPGTVEQAKLEMEHGILIWDIKFTNDNEVRIDAATGAVVRTEIENDNDDDRDDNDDDDNSGHGGDDDDDGDDDNSGHEGDDDDDDDDRDDDNSGHGGDDDDRDDD